MAKHHSIKPAPGYILAIPYVQEDTTFRQLKENAGEDQKSEIIAVGESVKDAYGVKRDAPCKKGDIVLHAASNKTVEIGFDPYRFIHFTEVHGVFKP